MYIVLMWMSTSPFPVFNFDDFDRHSLLLAKVCQKLEIENKNSKNEVSFESFNCKKWNKKLLKNYQISIFGFQYVGKKQKKILKNHD